MNIDELKNKISQVYDTEILAKLFSEENISIEFDSNIKTAAFSPTERKILIPIWDVSVDVITALIAHETGHAVYPCEYDLKYKDLYNIVDDCRIDKHRRKDFPGIKKNYWKLAEHIKTKFELPNKIGKDDKSFPDRLNLWSKCGTQINIEFSEKEFPLVEMAKRLETPEDVKTLVDAILQYTKEEKEDEEKEEKASNSSESNDDSSGDSSESNGDSSESNDDSSGDSSESNDDSSGDSSESNGDSSESNGDSSNEFNDLEITTKDLYENDVAEGLHYKEKTVKMEDYKTEFNVNRLLIDQPAVKDYISNDIVAEKTISFNKKLKTQHSSTINALCNKFQMMKTSKNISSVTSNKGKLDENLLYAHKTASEIFQRGIITTTDKTKHRLVFLIDFSGSMTHFSRYEYVTNQAFIMREFCKRMNIPYEMFVFTDFDEKYDNMKVGFKCDSIRLVCNETMSEEDVMKGFVVMGSQYSPGRYQTPLNNAMFSLLEYLKDKKYNEKLSVFVLTDGEATDGNEMDSVQNGRNVFSYKNKKYSFTDKEKMNIRTGGEYSRYSPTSWTIFSKIYKNNLDIHSMILFFLSDHTYTSPNEMIKESPNKMGFDMIYTIFSKMIIRTRITESKKEKKLEWKGEKGFEQLAISKFMSENKKKSIDLTIINSLIKSIA